MQKWDRFGPDQVAIVACLYLRPACCDGLCEWWLCILLHRAKSTRLSNSWSDFEGQLGEAVVASEVPSLSLLNDVCC